MMPILTDRRILVTYADIVTLLYTLLPTGPMTSLSMLDMINEVVKMNNFENCKI